MSDKHVSIFVIDDDQLALVYMEELLIDQKYDVHLYLSAEEANKDLLLINPDMILLDLNLKGMSGLDFLSLLKADKKTAHFPIIMLTSESSTEDMVDALKLGIADYITKPIKQEIFIARLHNHIKLSRYNKLFAQRTAEKLIESEKQLKSANKNLEKYNAELERLALALQDNDALLTQNNIELAKAKKKAEEGEQLKAAFLANVSHEIRTPMNAIMGFGTLLSRPVVNDASRLQYADIIKKSGKHLLELINTIIDLSKIDAGQAELDLQGCNVEQLIEDVYLMFKSAKADELKDHIDIIKEVEYIPTDALLDETRIKQVLINLMGNALKFTEIGTVELGCHLKENRLLFHVKDSGIGIPNDSKKMVFERFRQAKGQDSRRYGGAGLGLAISKECILLHGGKMWFESEEGKGTCFYFSIPYKPCQSATLLSRKDGLLLDLQGQRILIVDDDKIHQEHLMITLQSYRPLVKCADSAEEMFEVLPSFSPNVILLDVQLPGMDGWEATKKLKQQYPDCKVVIHTAYAFNKDRERSKECGADAYFAKPTESEDLIRELVALTHNDHDLHI